MPRTAHPAFPFNAENYTPMGRGRQSEKAGTCSADTPVCMSALGVDKNVSATRLLVVEGIVPQHFPAAYNLLYPWL
jgi:hypothetical protein